MNVKATIVLIVIGILIFFVILFGSSWYYDSTFYLRSQSQNEKYGFDFNEQRAQLGIPIIEKEWYTLDLTYRKRGARKYSPRNFWIKQTWSDFQEHNYPYHKEKTIFRDNDYQLDFENDKFINKTITGIVSLDITSYFDKRIKTGVLLANNDTDSMILIGKQIDSVLFKWYSKAQVDRRK